MTNKKITRALISVYDKSGLLELAKALAKSGCEIVSSGGTSAALKEAGIAVVTVESVTGAAQILGGRVKTLHPAIHGGILADLDNLEHKNDLLNNKISAFDLVIVNLYPFTKTVGSGATEAEIIEEIDIGGVALLRAAAKNFKHVSVISRVDQYQTLISKLSNGFSLQERKELASSAFTLTRDYDTAISGWLDPANISINFGGAKQLRYGENPHQSATLYRKDLVSGIAGAEQLHGKEMSFNNYLDADAAWRAANDHKGITVAIIKHTNPCGIAVDISCHTAHKKALACDPVSAFGGVVATNSKLTKECALQIAEVFTEVVIAPDYEVAALDILKTKANIRILKVSNFDQSKTEIRPVSGGLLVQQIDRVDSDGDSPINWKHVAGPDATAAQMIDLEFAWRSVRSVRSNGILIAKNCASIGVGMGQVNRLDSAKLATSAAGVAASGAVAASDAFFPFKDGIEILINSGVSAVVQPGGSVRDDEVIAAANKAGVSMYFTGIRHFSHS